MTDEEIIIFCIRHRITVEQYFFMWLIVRKDWTKPLRNSLAKQYLQECKGFDQELIDDLVDKGLVLDFNTEDQSRPEFYVVQDSLVSELYADENAGEELWNAYPATFPLSGGGSFVARAGGDKDDLIALYLKRIKNNPNLHKRVMVQLKRYVDKVRRGELNGHKISDWISTEMWNSIADLKETGGTKFGKDV